jgi:dTDP-4-dehydrorhamnose reductase
MRTLVTGVGGMLARGTLPLLDPDDTFGCDLPDCDITSPRSVTLRILTDRPELILHYAAFTDVYGAEADPARAFEVNALGSENVARGASSVDARLVAMSTDYVFDGNGDRPYREDDPVGPLSVYGASKLEGEQRALALWPDTLVVRTAWLFGEGGRNFIDTIAGKLRAGEPVSVVDDQVGRPTLTRDLAAGILALAGRASRGVFHLTNQGEPASWFDVATFVAECVGADAGLVSRTTTEALGRPAPRPAYSVLDDAKAVSAGVPRLRDWREAVADHLGATKGGADA